MLAGTDLLHASPAAGCVAAAHSMMLAAAGAPRVASAHGRQDFTCCSPSGSWATGRGSWVTRQVASAEAASVEPVKRAAAGSRCVGVGWTAGDTLPRCDPEATASPNSTGDVRWMTLQVKQASSLPASLQAYNHPMVAVDYADQPSWMWSEPRATRREDA